MANCTFSENKAMGGSGGDVDAVGLTFIAGEGEIKSEGYNIDSDGSCRLHATGDRFGIDPELDSLKNNGGSTETYALRPGSPAIDGGNPAGCTDHKGKTISSDQRAHSRPSGAQCDIGAFEASHP